MGRYTIMTQEILFVCNHNAGRSQMAEAYLNARYRDRYAAFSAGNYPSASMSEYTVRVMEEAGIPMTGHAPKSLAEFMDRQFDTIARLCDCSGTCPVLPSARRVIDHPISDPSRFVGDDGDIIEGFREVRDEVFAWVDETFGAAATGVAITWQRPDGPMPPVVLCSDTNRPLQEVIRDIRSLLEKRGIPCTITEENGPMQLSFNGVPFEKIVPLYVPKTCSMCGSCDGSEGECSGGRRYEGIPESVVRLAAMRAAGLK
jgi:arsenate reductase (thioredoxin)